MSRFHTLTVSAVQRETSDAVSVSFLVPDQLDNSFRYISGQYLTLRLHINGQTVQRSYSFCSSASFNEPLTIAVKQVEGGLMSSYINQKLKAGDVVEVMEPMGNFHSPISASNKRHIVLFGGGSGITPLLSILKTVLKEEPLSKVTLFYGNRNESSIIFKKVLENIQSEFGDRFKTVHILDDGSVAEKGPMTGDVIKNLLSNYIGNEIRNAEYFICGPTPMMKAAEQTLRELQVSDASVHIEYFTAKDDADKKAADVGSAGSEPYTGKANVTIIYDGNKVNFEVSESETILNAALDAGYDPPYSCMVAACCTCRAKLVEGKVEMDDRESLTDAEISNGYVLTCQAHAKSNTVVLNYDI